MTSPGKKRAIPESHYLANPTQRRNIKSSAVIYQLFLALSSYWEFSKYAVLSWVERRLPNDECSSHTCYKYWDPCELAQDTIHEDHSLFKKLPPHLFIGMTGQTLLLNPCSWRADLLQKECESVDCRSTSWELFVRLPSLSSLHSQEDYLVLWFSFCWFDCSLVHPCLCHFNLPLCQTQVPLFPSSSSYSLNLFLFLFPSLQHIFGFSAFETELFCHDMKLSAEALLLAKKRQMFYLQ